ncbi:hypothetical protein R1flu_020725 [Riccia fluitans]|uniref:Uncharacterized protein n=1 Tax=Riccia fluitans TaxID=41844 RepID=A0ABD1ZNI0_9MARC
MRRRTEARQGIRSKDTLDSMPIEDTITTSSRASQVVATDSKETRGAPRRGPSGTNHESNNGQRGRRVRQAKTPKDKILDTFVESP